MPAARFETKAGSGSGAGYERWRSWEYRPSTERDGKEDVYVPHHRLLAIVECYALSTPLWAIFADLDGSDIHHENGLKWDNRGENIEVVDHGEHAALHAPTASETPIPDTGRDLEVRAMTDGTTSEGVCFNGPQLRLFEDWGKNNVIIERTDQLPGSWYRSFV